MAHDVVGDGAVNHPVLEAASELGEEGDVVGGPVDHALAVAGEQRSVVHGLHRREVLLALQDSLGEAIEDPPSTFRTERRPGGEGAAGRADGAVDVGRAPGGDLTEHQPVDGREDRERAGAAAAGSPPIQWHVSTSTLPIRMRALIGPASCFPARGAPERVAQEPLQDLARPRLRQRLE